MLARHSTTKARSTLACVVAALLLSAGCVGLAAVSGSADAAAAPSGPLIAGPAADPTTDPTAEPTAEPTPADPPTTTETPTQQPDPTAPATETSQPEAPSTPSQTDVTPSAAPSPTAEDELTAARIEVNPADNALIAWVGGDTQPPTLVTLQAAFTAAAAGDTVHTVQGEFTFTKVLTVPQAVTLTSADPSEISARFTVSGGGLTTSAITLHPPVISVPVITVVASGAGAVLDGITVTNPALRTGTSGISLAAGANGVRVVDLSVDMGGPAAGTTNGIATATTSGLVLENPTITGVARGVYGTATSGPGMQVTGGTIRAATIGIQTGTTTAPTFDGVTITSSAPGAAGTTHGINLVGSTGAVVTGVNVSGFQRGISTTDGVTGTGIQVSNSSIGAYLFGITTGATSGAVFDGVTLTGQAVANSVALDLSTSSGVEVKGTTLITNFRVGIGTDNVTTGPGLKIVEGTTTIRGPLLQAITLGSTDGAHLVGLVIEGTWSAGDAAVSVGIDMYRASGVVIENPTISGIAQGISANNLGAAGPNRVGLQLTGGQITGASGGVRVANATGVTVTGTQISLVSGAGGGGGIGIAGHECADVTVSDVTVDGYVNPDDYRRGSAGVRFYFTQGVNVTRTTLTNGSNGFYWDMTEDVTVTDSDVTGQTWYATYTESVRNYTVTNSRFIGNAGVANLTINDQELPPLNKRQISRDITFANNTLTDNFQGVYLPLGADGFTYVDNTVSGAPAQFVVYGTPAHNVTVEDNDIDFTPLLDTYAAIWFGTSYPNLDTENYTSSNIQVLSNRFTGPGPFIQAGSATGIHDALADIIEVSGNVFPRNSVAIRSYPNAEQAVTDDPPTSGVTAIDARDGQSSGPNDFGSLCRARVTSGPTQTEADPLIYSGGGSWIHETREPQVLYPESCTALAEMDLTIVEEQVTPGPHFNGDTVTWTLTPHNYGPRPAAAGWSMTQLLPAGLELVSISGAGYSYDDSDPANPVATSTDALPAGQDGPVVTVTAQVVADPGSLVKNVSYISPAPGDVVETIPLVVPDLDTETAASATNNDDQGLLLVGTRPLIDLTVTENLTGTGPYVAGQVVVWTLTPHNNGPGTALAGWSVTQLIPEGLELISVTGPGYGTRPTSSGTTTVVAGTALDAGEDGPVLTFTARVSPDSGAAELKNVAYIRPAGSDVPETNSLIVPDLDTDTVASATNNDTEGDITVRAQAIDLTLSETITSAGPYRNGDTVTWTLTPHNNGPDVAAAGWSVMQLFPEGVQVVSVTGAGYTFPGSEPPARPQRGTLSLSDLLRGPLAEAGINPTGPGFGAGLLRPAAAERRLVASAPIAAGEDGPPLNVTVRITGASDPVTNVAYVMPADGDTAESNALVVPDLTTDTVASGTNNDTEGQVELVAPPNPPNPPGPPPPGTGPGGENGPDAPSGPGGGLLPFTGSAIQASLLLIAVALILAGSGAVWLSRRGGQNRPQPGSDG